MTSLPFPSFVHDVPVDVSNGRASLAAVGACRIHPLTCGSKDTVEAYMAICAKNREQASVPSSDESNVQKLSGSSGSGSTNANADADDRSIVKEANKKLKKKFMKQGVAMASTYLQDTLQLDVSIINVQISIDSKDVMESDGCLVACLLDAGCSAVVLDGTDLQALDTARVPRERVVANFVNESVATPEAVKAALSFAGTISVTLSTSSSSDTDYCVSDVIQTVDKILSLVPNKSDKLIFELVPSSTSSITEAVSQISRKCGDFKGSIGLVDPSVQDLGLCYSACMRTDRPDGLYTTVVCTRSGEALGLVYSSKESIVAALECGRGVYYSRSRNGLWRKGDTSGHFQTLHRVDVDCDGDALRFTVTQRGDDTAAFCHLNTLTCWGEPCGLRLLETTLQERLISAPAGSYTKRLFDDPELLRDKLVEEAQELSEATEPKDVAGELADVLYFAMARAAKAGVSIDDAVAELDRRTRKVTRRKGDSKAFRIAAGSEILSKAT
jgi:phosphoribosyl-ATP pyrophosphohydrolase/phosphoribosyl-AMP cyclohydrolase/histidinol dehydrogenase